MSAGTRSRTLRTTAGSATRPPGPPKKAWKSRNTKSAASSIPSTTSSAFTGARVSSRPGRPSADRPVVCFQT